jgi:hypothetical protein
MKKNSYPADDSGLLYSAIFDRALSRPPFPADQLCIEEFGVSAKQALSPDILLKKIAYEEEGSEHSEVFLCYNWKQQNPFVVVKRRRDHATRSYTPQYGQEDNYPESRWSETSFQFYSPSELNNRQPEIAAILSQL